MLRQKRYVCSRGTLGAAFFKFCVVVGAMAAEPDTPALFQLSGVLPEGRCELQIMTVQLSARANELGGKLQASAAANREWFLKQVKKTAPGKPMDYDPRLGLTKQEYAEFLRESQHRQLVATGQVLACTFRKTGDALSLDVEDAGSPLRQIQLNLVTGELSASAGKMGKATWASSDDSQSAIGAHDRCSWTYDKSNLDAMDVRLVKLDIYRLKASGKILWRFQDSELVHGQINQQFEIVFQHSPTNVQPTGQSKPSETHTGSPTTHGAGER